MKTASIIRTGGIVYKHFMTLHGAIYNCCMFKSQIGSWGEGAGANFGD